jgi:hypothetical protein
MVLGRSRSGKTHWLVEQLNKLVGETREVDGITRPIFDKIIIFTESLNAEPFDNLDKKLPIIFIKGYISKVVLLLKRCNDETHNRYRWLCVLDDCLGSASGKSLRGGAFSKQMLTFRNANISTVVCVQGCTLLDPKTRENAHQIVITGMKLRDQTRACNELLYDDCRKYLPEHEKLKGEKLATKFFELVGDDVLIYDNLNNKSFLYKRKKFSK